MIFLYAFLSLVSVILLILFLPLRGKVHKLPVPVRHIDERDTMFSRNEIKQGEKRFDEYYRMHPEHRESDDSFRSKPGLLSPETTNYSRYAFASADASFEAVKAFFPCRGKAQSIEHRAQGRDAELCASDSAGELSLFLKEWGKKMGAHSVGITEMRDYHFYTYGGRRERYGKEVINNHKYGITITVEMDHELIRTGPQAPTVVESAHQYLKSGMIATQLALTLRNLGYEATSHIDANYDVICPLVARDAGLGEIGRMGLLMTPRLGTRVRIAVVTTDAPLQADETAFNNTVIDFCTLCKKCARVCPSSSIPYGERENHPGGLRWQINQESCFNYWCRVGTDCGRCIAVCPYSHKSNMFHNFIRWGIRNNYLFRRLAVKMDDIFYGPRPKPGSVPEWVKG
ncbi:MAG: reductive dehalogenase domain-containing protein [Bacteroidota bacterium]|nr:reductive dehalogenase domain-containing protein [Bacteroidota bacterium]